MSALCVWGMGFERCNSEKMEQRFKDASCLIFIALMCLAVLSLKLPTQVSFFIKIYTLILADSHV